MRKIIIFIVLFVVSCSPQEVTGTVIDKVYEPEWTETIPPGYRLDCGITIKGKYECGTKFFISTKTEFHPEKYIISLSTIDGKLCEFRTTKEEYDSVAIGNQITLSGYCN